MTAAGSSSAVRREARECTKQRQKYVQQGKYALIETVRRG